MPASIMPMLAAKVEIDQLPKLQFPILGQIKYDGIRAIIDKGVALSRTMKLIPNQHIQDYFHDLHVDYPFTNGWDGELLVGDPTDKAICMSTTSGVMSHQGIPDFKYYLFDRWNEPGMEYHKRRALTTQQWFRLPPRIRDKIILCDEVPLQSAAEIERTAELYMDAGHEGLMLRNAFGFYKYGRSTVKQQGLLKLKAFADDEATVVGYEELYRNHNEAFTNETGHTKRSTHKENKTAANTLGALIVQSPKWTSTFNIGTGFTADQRQFIWDYRHTHMGKIVKFKYLASGMKDVPRHPVFIAWRDKIDWNEKDGN